MEERAIKNQAMVSDSSLDSLHKDAGDGDIVLGSAFARFGCAAILLIAAALKAYQLFTDPGLGVIHGSRWLETAIIEYESLLSIWLLSGVALQWGRRIALVTFLGFGCYTFILGISGASSCGCVGKIQVNPWWTFGLDAALVILLFVWKPRRVRDDFKPASGYLHFTVRIVLVIAALFTVIGIPVLLVAVRPPGSDLSIESALANSPFVLLEPENWIGKPFPLTDFIDISERERLSRGSWIVVFYRHDCPKCQQALPRYERLAEELISAKEDTHIALIEIPPYGPAVLSIQSTCRLGRLNDSKEWIITTPAEVRITNGQVIAANEMVPDRQTGDSLHDEPAAP
jgi:thiol-disulfide isomerase/thioredoxin